MHPKALPGMERLDPHGPSENHGLHAEESIEWQAQPWKVGASKWVRHGVSTNQRTPYLGGFFLAAPLSGLKREQGVIC